MKQNVLKPKPKQPKQRKPLFAGLRKLLGFKVPGSAKTALETPKDIISGDIIDTPESSRLLNILIWLTALGFIYITNNYWAEQKIREINRREKILKEMRYEYISQKSKLMTMSRQSEVLQILKSKGYKENTEPLKVIKINKKELEQIKK